MADLKSFISSVSQDSALRSKYLKDPNQTMVEAGLSQADRDAVMSGDRAKIAAQIDPSGSNVAGFGISVTVAILLGIS